MGKKNGNGGSSTALPATVGRLVPLLASNAADDPFADIPGYGMSNGGSIRDDADQVRLPQIESLHGAEMFKMPDGSKVAEIDCRIIDTHRCNAWWALPIEDGGGAPPSCVSLDGRTLHVENSSEPQSEDGTCATCPMAQFGSDRKGGRGRDCKFMRRLHLHIEGHMLPMRLTLTVSSFGNWDEYVSLLADQRRRYYYAGTRIKLVPGEREGFSYSVATFEPDLSALVNGGDAKRLAAFMEFWRPVIRRQRVEAEETGIKSADADEHGGPVAEGTEPYDKQF